MSEKDSAFYRLLGQYRELNQHYLTRYKSILKYLKKFNELEDIEADNFFGFSNKVLGNGSGIKFKELHNILKINSRRIINICNQIIEIINEEEKKLKDHLSGVISEDFAVIKSVEGILSEYNEKRQILEVQLKTILGDWIKTGTQEFRVEELTAQKSSDNLEAFYDGIVSSIKDKNDKGALFNLLNRLFNYLGNFIEKEGITSYLKNELVGKLNGNSLKFINNFFGPGGSSGTSYINKLNEFNKEIKSKENYESLEDGKKKKLNKAMQDILKELFAGNDNEFEVIRDRIDEIFDDKKDGGGDSDDEKVKDNDFTKLKGYISEIISHKDEEGEIGKIWKNLFDHLFEKINNEDSMFKSKRFLKFVKYVKRKPDSYSSDISEILNLANTVGNSSSNYIQIFEILKKVNELLELNFTLDSGY